ncbi:ABC transporter permease [Actinomadura sp. HBU206391]|uniref:ABC transporter permease n=1 Tax=Actinomadura sp. HBU206391 TaxID=2731692 RepID=UPI00164F523A|nr:ABC transporter permease [Actinomadura sp. HBU206391]MBC6463617.1 ABC transporter permease [Actinomadura sp. HBU206391]
MTTLAGTARRTLLSVASPVVVLALWELLTRTKAIDTRFWPAPTTIASNLWDAFVHGTLRHDVGVTTVRLLIGIAIGATAGIVVGLGMGLSRTFRTLVRPLMAMTYPIPKIAVLPLFLLVFGLGETTMWAIVSVGVFYLVAMNSFAGIREIDPIYGETATVYRVSHWRRIWTVALPGALPLMLTGIELGIGVGFLLVVSAEFVNGSTGLGHAIWQAWQTFDVPLMYAALAVIAIYGLIVQVVMRTLHKRLVPWRIEHD